jgi:hypothetical protein
VKRRQLFPLQPTSGAGRGAWVALEIASSSRSRDVAAKRSTPTNLASESAVSLSSIKSPLDRTMNAAAFIALA